MNLQYWSHRLPFTHPFTIASGTKTHQPTLIVALQLGNIVGFGEAPAISYYNITVEKMMEDLAAKAKYVEKFAFTDPERYWHYLHHLFPGNPFLVSALDMAGWDLWGKMKRKPLYELFGNTMENLPDTDYTIGIDTIDKMVEKMKEKPWPIYKIKLGTGNDVSIVQSIRQHTNAILRVDANAAWTAEEALTIIPELQKLGVELVEQPLHKENWEGMKALHGKFNIPLIADESCVFESDVEKCLDHFDGINIKLTKCSGITPARRMIKKARQYNLKIMMGSMNESSIGSSAIVHFLSQIDFADIDGPLLLASDLASGLLYNHGQVRVNAGVGLCINPAF